MSLPGAYCLDLFSGTGVLAFEALSRSAALAVMIEQDHSLVQILTDNNQRLNAETTEIICCDALEWLGQSDRTFDIIFLDPPFHQNLVAKACQHIQNNGNLKPRGYLYIESEIGLEIPECFVLHKQKQAGQVQYGLYQLNE